MGRTKKKRQSRKTKKQKGGAFNPLFFDPKKAYSVTSDLVKGFKKTKKSKAKMKSEVQTIKRQFKKYKSSGGTDSLTTWGKKKGHLKRVPANCSVM